MLNSAKTLGYTWSSVLKSRMMGDYHVRFCERFRGEIPLYLLDFIYYYMLLMFSVLFLFLLLLSFMLFGDATRVFEPYISYKIGFGSLKITLEDCLLEYVEDNIIHLVLLTIDLFLLTTLYLFSF